MCHQPQHGPPSLSEFPTIEQSVTARSADQPATRGNPDWATLASTPIAHSNRFAPLSTEEDEQNDAVTDQGAYIQVSRNKNKRPRNRGSPQPARGVVRDGAAATSRRAPTVLGRSRISASKAVAAKPIRKQSVFCIDDLGTSYTADDITTYVTKELSVEVLSCFEAKPRRRRQDRESVITRKAFRLCICEDDCARLLDPTVWPDSIMISEWFFKSQSEVDKRPRLDVNPAVAASSGSTPLIHTDTTVMQVGSPAVTAAAKAISSPAHQKNTTSDDTVLAACMDNMNDGGE